MLVDLSMADILAIREEYHHVVTSRTARIATASALGRVVAAIERAEHPFIVVDHGLAHDDYLDGPSRTSDWPIR